MNTNIHDVVAIALLEPKDLGCSWVRDVVFTRQDGKTYTVTAFAPQPANLLVGTLPEEPPVEEIDDE